MKIIVLILILALFLTACAKQEYIETPEVSDEYCSSLTGQTMSLKDAIEIGKTSCGDVLEEDHLCNYNTGTWWIETSLEKEGCSPACVINVETSETEINWRCTGLK